MLLGCKSIFPLLTFTFSRNVRLAPAAVNSEVELLQGFAGDEPSAPLKDIQFTSRK